MGYVMYFILNEWPCNKLGKDDASQSHGPFSITNTPLDTIKNWMTEQSISFLYNLLFSPIPWILVWGMTYTTSKYRMHERESLKERIVKDQLLYENNMDVLKKQ